MAHKYQHMTGHRAEPITAIIPAYNEAKRIGNVIEAVVRTPLITQIIVVDDGSTDDTAGVVKTWQQRDKRILLIEQKRNQGKAAAIAAGGEQAAGDIVVLLDADLSGLQPQHIRKLITPVRQRICAMTMGLFHNGRRSTDLTHRYLPFLSGQRCLRWSLFRETLSRPSAGWSLETALNLHAWYWQYETRRVKWDGVTHAMRPEKHPGLAGYTSHIKMWWQIARYTAKFAGRVGAGELLARMQQPKLTPVWATGSFAHHNGRNSRTEVMRRPPV